MIENIAGKMRKHQLLALSPFAMMLLAILFFSQLTLSQTSPCIYMSAVQIF